MAVEHPMRERTVAGYRVLRTLARGERSEILLGFDPPVPGTEAPGATVALKVIPDPRPVAAEIEALTRGSGDHVVRLLDVSIGDDGACLVLERLERGGLTDLMRRRATLAAGEVVTIVAPLTAALQRLHDAGVAHGRISPGVIAFSASGAPVLTGFGPAELFPPGSPEIVRERIAAVLADRRAIGDLAIALLGRVAGPAAAAVGGVEQLLAGDSAEFLTGLSDLLFGIAAASPVRFESDPDPAPSMPQRMVTVVDPVDGVGPIGPDDPVDPGVRSTRAGGEVPLPGSPRFAWLTGVLPDALRDRLARVADEPFVAALRERWGAATRGSRRVVIAVGALGVTLAVALAVPSGGQPGTAEAPVGQTASPVAVGDDPAVSDDDPLAAVPVLWERRRDCLRELSILCLDGVDQPGSAAFEVDRALITAVGAGGALPAELVPNAELFLVERLGDSALVDLPDGLEVDAVLLMRGLDGWRIRDYLVTPAEDEQFG